MKNLQIYLLLFYFGLSFCQTTPPSTPPRKSKLKFLENCSSTPPKKVRCEIVCPPAPNRNNGKERFEESEEFSPKELIRIKKFFKKLNNYEFGVELNSQEKSQVMTYACDPCLIERLNLVMSVCKRFLSESELEILKNRLEKYKTEKPQGEDAEILFSRAAKVLAFLEELKC